MKDLHKRKIGILGGGQLGKMLVTPAHRLGLDVSLLDKDNSFPAYANNSQFVFGDFTNYEDVVRFGKDKDVVTVEIERVNTEALKYLESQGVNVYPQSDKLELIKDKGLQKAFYADNNFPTAPYVLVDSKEELIEKTRLGSIQFPFVQKARKDGYDGKGVAVIKSSEDMIKLLDGPCVIEEAVNIDKEISVIAVRNPSGDVKVFPVVEMVFHPTANLVEFLCSPARIPEDKSEEAYTLAKSLIKKMEIVGLLAVEMFLNKEGQILINEVAPRPHNSGHQTIEGNVTSQFEQHIRAILDLPLGDTSNVQASVMLNILGHPDYTGDAKYQGLEKLLDESGVYPHIYGKKITKPYRKMGHITLTGTNLDEVINKAERIKNLLNVIS